jgi:hypothetical protein
MKHKPKITQAEQSRRFIEAAKAAGADEDNGALADALRKIAKPPKKQPPKKRG